MKKTLYQTEGYRILESEATDIGIDILKGDSYSPEVNPSIDPDELKKQERAFERLVESSGVFGYVLEKQCECCGSWDHVDSCWGFVGQYSESIPDQCHYIVDELKAQIKQGETK